MFVLSTSKRESIPITGKIKYVGKNTIIAPLFIRGNLSGEINGNRQETTVKIVLKYPGENKIDLNRTLALNEIFYIFNKTVQISGLVEAN